ncbi:Endopolyphosphatase [Microbotryomycetes sp. JL221]|nr:Endopolyphosphatase [Microbotryomycetes sp. JL221]
MTSFVVVIGALALALATASTCQAQVLGNTLHQQQQHVLGYDYKGGMAAPSKLHGRFIHLTDMHPDPFYKFNSSEAGSCHSHEPAKGDRAGYWGQPVSDCDSPLTLINATFDWLELHFKNKVDFVVWTGDNARHDIDTRFPRSLPEILNLNRYIAGRMRKTFGHVPVVTSIGNNDVFPHNIMFAGPSKITSELLSIWKHYIPEVHLHSFAGGGYYSVEAIPGHLLLVSLNTIYFFENNKAVDGCPSFTSIAKELYETDEQDDEPVSTTKKDEDPGTIQLLWLEQQLLLARARGMQVWLTGHVPATKQNWYEGCYRRYSQLSLAYHDTIVGHLFGHLNIDHFTTLQAKDAFNDHKKNKRRRKHKKGKGGKLEDDNDDRLGRFPEDRPRIQGSVSALLSDLLEQYKDLPAPRKAKVQDYSVVNVNPSVVPTYLPAFRIWEYNTSVEARWRQPPDWETGAAPFAEDEDEDDLKVTRSGDGGRSLSNMWQCLIDLYSDAFPAQVITRHKHKKHRKHKKKKRKSKWPSYPRLQRHHNPSSPSQHNSYLTPVGYTQYMLDLDRVNSFDGFGSAEGRVKGERPLPEWQIEYTTLDAQVVAKRLLSPSSLKDEDGSGTLSGQHEVWPPSVRRLVENGATTQEVADTLKKEGLTPYELQDLTIKSWLELGHKLGKQDKEWQDYRKRMFVSSGADG